MDESPKNKVTAIILNYNRGKNLPDVIQGIREQSVSADIWLWENAGIYDLYEDDICPDIHIASNFNFGMHPRIALSGMVNTDYIWWNDDDRKITDPELFAKLIQEMEDTDANILGINGRNFDDVKDWNKPYQTSGWAGPGWVKFVNTGFSFINADMIGAITTAAAAYEPNDILYGDDMIVSYALRPVWVSEHIEKAITPIDECGIGLSHQTMHMDIRNKLCREFWGPK